MAKKKEMFVITKREMCSAGTKLLYDTETPVAIVRKKGKAVKLVDKFNDRFGEPYKENDTVTSAYFFWYRTSVL